MMPPENTASLVATWLAGESRSKEARTAGCSCGYSTQLRAAATSARASWVTPSASSSESLTSGGDDTILGYYRQDASGRYHPEKTGRRRSHLRRTALFRAGRHRRLASGLSGGGA